MLNLSGVARVRRHTARPWIVAMLCLLSAACWHHKRPEVPYVRPDPIVVHIDSENFLDANVYLIASGVSHRLGLVIGNTKANFEFPWTNALSNGAVVSVTMVGGGRVQSLNLSVSPGQVIDYKIASVLNQSYGTVHDP